MISTKLWSKVNQIIRTKLSLPRRAYVTALVERGLVKDVFPNNAL